MPMLPNPFQCIPTHSIGLQSILMDPGPFHCTPIHLFWGGRQNGRSPLLYYKHFRLNCNHVMTVTQPTANCYTSHVCSTYQASVANGAELLLASGWAQLLSELLSASAQKRCSGMTVRANLSQCNMLCMRWITSGPNPND